MVKRVVKVYLSVYSMVLWLVCIVVMLFSIMMVMLLRIIVMSIRLNSWLVCVLVLKMMVYSCSC